MRMPIARRTLADGRAGWGLVCPSSSSSKKKRRGGSWCWGTLGRSPVRPSDLRVGGLPRHPKNVVQLLVPHGEHPFRTLSLSLSLSPLASRQILSPLFESDFRNQISNLKINMLRQLLYGWQRSAAAGGHGVREGEGGEGGLWIVEVGRSRGEDPVVPGRRDPARRERGEDGNDAEEGGPHGLGGRGRGEPGGEATELGARGRLARREGPRRGRADPR